MLQGLEYSKICGIRIPSVSFADSVPTPFDPSGHFPLTGGIGPLSLFMRFSLTCLESYAILYLAMQNT